MWELNEVWLGSGSLNEFLRTPSLALNVVEVRPMYVFSGSTVGADSSLAFLTAIKFSQFCVQL